MKILCLAVFLSMLLSRNVYAQGAELPNVWLCEQEDMYTYQDMQTDLHLLQKTYPSFVHVDGLGTTMDGRTLYHIVIGSENAQNHVLIFGSIHAREYMTTQLVMKLTKDFIEGLGTENHQYKGKTYLELLENTAVHVVPMVNPDGVTLSQFGLNGMKKESTRKKIYEIYELDSAIELEPYLKKWKSNAEGVDINRNFDALWDQYNDHLGHPSSDHYKGVFAGSTEEARALISLTEQYKFKRTISYHAQGEVIYWYFGQQGGLLEESRKFAQSISEITGYALDSNYEKLDPAGYKDWAIKEKGIVSLTIEVGTGEVPLDESLFSLIYIQNEKVIPETLLSLNEDAVTE